MKCIPVIYRKKKKSTEYTEEQENVLRELGQWEEGEYIEETEDMWLDPGQYRLQVHRDLESEGQRTVIEFCDKQGRCVTSAVCVLPIENVLEILFGIIVR